jgi:serine/threonine-protein kinase HipA
MNSVGIVRFNGTKAGRLERREGDFIFTYDQAYQADVSLPPLALSFPKHRREFRSPTLFPFFYGLLAEGENVQLQCRLLNIDDDDHFTRLLKTAGSNTIGAVTVREEA